jgi:hypothetical protein
LAPLAGELRWRDGEETNDAESEQRCDADVCPAGIGGG